MSDPLSSIQHPDNPAIMRRPGRRARGRLAKCHRNGKVNNTRTALVERMRAQRKRALLALNADPSVRKLVRGRKRRDTANQIARIKSKIKKPKITKKPAKTRGSLHASARRNAFICSEATLASDDEASSDEEDGEDTALYLKGLVEEKVRYEKGAKRRSARSELTSHMRSL
ncbi:hypothetical protein OC845_006693, partial [Tilletia horrida]